MSKSVEEVRRAAFEAAYLKKYFYSAERWSLVPEKYRTQHAEIAWWAFSAALDSICIELPALIEPEPPEDAFDDSWCDGYAAADRYRNKCRAAIEQTGLGLRVK